MLTSLLRLFTTSSPKAYDARFIAIVADRCGVMLVPKRVRGLRHPSARSTHNNALGGKGQLPAAKPAVARAFASAAGKSTGDDLRESLRTAIELEELSFYANVHAGTSSFASLLQRCHKMLNDKQLAAEVLKYEDLPAQTREAVVTALRSWVGLPKPSSSSAKSQAPRAAAASSTPTPQSAPAEPPTASDADAAAAAAAPLPTNSTTTGTPAAAPGSQHPFNQYWPSQPQPAEPPTTYDAAAAAAANLSDFWPTQQAQQRPSRPGPYNPMSRHSPAPPASRPAAHLPPYTYHPDNLGSRGAPRAPWPALPFVPEPSSATTDAQPPSAPPTAATPAPTATSYPYQANLPGSPPVQNPPPSQSWAPLSLTHRGSHPPAAQPARQSTPAPASQPRRLPAPGSWPASPPRRPSQDYPLIAPKAIKQLPRELVNRALQLTASGPRHYFIFDLETAGLSDAAITQLYFHHHQSNQGFNLFVYPFRNLTTQIDPQAVRVNNIDLVLLQEQGAQPFDAHAAEALLRWMLERLGPEGGVPVLVAHNGYRFDIPVLQRHWSACGFDLPPSWLQFDTMAFYRQVIKPLPHNPLLHIATPGYLDRLHVDFRLQEDSTWNKWEQTWRTCAKLQFLRLVYDIRMDADAHRADGDVAVMMAIADKIAQELEMESLADLLDTIGRGAFNGTLKKHIYGYADRRDATVGSASASAGASSELASSESDSEPLDEDGMEIVLQATISSTISPTSTTNATTNTSTSTSASSSSSTTTSSTLEEASTLSTSLAEVAIVSSSSTEVTDAAELLLLEAKRGRPPGSKNRTTATTTPTSTSSSDADAASSASDSAAAALAAAAAASSSTGGGGDGGEGGKGSSRKAKAKPKGDFRYRLNGEPDRLLWNLGTMQISAEQAADAWGPCTLTFAEWDNVVEGPSTKAHMTDLSNMQSAGFANILELLMHLPRAYEPYSRTVEDKAQQAVLLLVDRVKWRGRRGYNAISVRAPAEWAPGGHVTITGEKYSKYPPPRSADDKALLKAVLEQAGPGNFTIAKTPPFDTWVASNALAASPHPLHIFPTYPARTPFKAEEFSGKSSRRGLLPRVLEAFADTPGAQDPLPEGVAERENLMGWVEALQCVHQPQGIPQWREVLDRAKYRLAFQELFFLQLSMLLQRSLLQGLLAETDATPRAPSLTKTALMEALIKGLPFELTNAQKKALAEIQEDAALDRPMLRMLQGDVGSGKTAVALLFMLMAVEAGYQGVLLAPTMLLATQHFGTLDKWRKYLPSHLQDQVKVALLTGDIGRQRKEVKEAIASGKINIVVGTHAVLNVAEWHKLGAIVIDEQHRFGVKQRETLASVTQGLAPHVLTMTATPIPRSLALVAFGSCNHSVLNELPPGRKPIITEVVSNSKTARKKVYEEIRDEVATGGRAYIVCPLVEESESERMSELQAATVLHEELQSSKVLQGIGVGLVHGRVSADEKDKAMADFKSGVTPVLVSTTVIEVGVDVPEASIMVVQDADRFGLAQLHQLRGRVGRGERQSRCFLLASSKSIERLAVMEASSDGFVVAEADLAFRGPGDLLGTRQSGRNLSALSLGVMAGHPEVMEKARAAANETLEASGGSLSPRLMAALNAYGFTQFDQVTGLGA